MLFIINRSTGVSGVICSQDELEAYVHVQAGACRFGTRQTITLHIVTDVHSHEFSIGMEPDLDAVLAAILERVPFEDMRVVTWEDWPEEDRACGNVDLEGVNRWCWFAAGQEFTWTRHVLQGVDGNDEADYVWQHQLTKVDEAHPFELQAMGTPPQS